MRLVIANNGPVYLDQDTQFSVNVVNQGDAPTSGTVVLTPGVQVSVAGWNCGYENNNGNFVQQCSRGEILAPGDSFPALPITIPAPPPYAQTYTPSIAQVVSGGGSPRSDGHSAAAVIPINSICPFVYQTDTYGIVYKQTTVSRLGGTYSLYLAANPGCPWQATSSAPWLTAPANGSGVYTVAPNTTNAARTAILNFTSTTGWSDTLTIMQTAQQCLDNFPEGDQIFQQQGGFFNFGFSVESGCPTTPSTDVSWLSLTAGTGGFFGQVFPNTTGLLRKGTVTIGNGSVAFFQLGSSQSPALSGTIAHAAVGGNWETTVQVVNASSLLNPVHITLPQNFPAFVDSTNFYEPAPSVYEVLAPHASLGVHSSAPGSAVVTVGAAGLQFDQGIGAFVRFRYVPNGQEALVPLETRNAESYTLGFDNTNGLATGIAIATPAGASTTTNVNVTIRDDGGNLIDSGTVAMNPNTHDSYTLGDRFPKAIDRSGSVRYSTAAPGQISVLGIRFPPSAQFSTIPPASEIDPGSGSLPQLTVGGGWSTTVEILNTTASAASVSLALLSSSGTPLVLPLSVGGATTNASQWQGTLPAFARTVISIAGPASGATVIGSARLGSSAGVSGFIRYSFAGQDAIVPLETRNSSNYVVAFDNTAGATTGIAVTNVSSNSTSIPVTIYDQTGTVLGTDSIALPPQGQTAYVLSDRVAGARNVTGSAVFSTPAGGSISVLGIRYPSSGSFTTIPVITP